MPKLRRPASPVATKGDLARLEATVTENHRDLLKYMDTRFQRQDERLDRQDERLAAIAQDIALMKNALVELAGQERHLRNLVRELRNKGVEVDESAVFA